MSGKKGLERENKIVNLIHDFVGDELNHFGINVLVPKEMENVKDSGTWFFWQGYCTIGTIYKVDRVGTVHAGTPITCFGKILIKKQDEIQIF